MMPFLIHPDFRDFADHTSPLPMTWMFLILNTFYSQVDGTTDVKYIMDTWTRQMGFPYVNLTFSKGQGRKKPTKVKATQARFLSVPGTKFDVNDSPFGYFIEFFSHSLYIQKKQVIVIMWETGSSKLYLSVCVSVCVCVCIPLSPIILDQST